MVADADALLAQMTAHHVRVAHPGRPCREDGRGVCVAAGPPGGAVWLAVYPSGGIAGGGFHRDAASAIAAAVGGVLVELPIVEDHRR